MEHPGSLSPAEDITSSYRESKSMMNGKGRMQRKLPDTASVRFRIFMTDRERK
jgi:hypothetical protein